MGEFVEEAEAEKRAAQERLVDAVRIFAIAAQELFERYEVQPDDHKIVQIGRCWLTWGDFRKIHDLYAASLKEG